MHDIEPYYHWRHLYTAEADPRSIFFGRTYSEFEFSQTVYNYYIHPQWDEFGSKTLYLKILYADYDSKFAIIELIGEWNDAIEKFTEDTIRAYGISPWNIQLMLYKLTAAFKEKNTFIHSTINREDDIETSQIQLSGRITQLLPFMRKFDPENKIFYNLKYTEIDSDSTLLNNTAIRYFFLSFL